MNDGNLRFVISEISDESHFDLVRSVAPAAIELLQPFHEGLNPLKNERGVPARNTNYFENTVPIYSISEYKSQFRMSRNAVEVMIQTVGRKLDIDHRIPIEKKCHFTLWMLSKPETFLAAGDRFNFAKSTGHKVFTQVVNALVQSIDNFIEWPNAMRLQQSSQVFLALSQGFPGIVGAIDATHIRIIQPKKNPTDYFNRKQVHSVILQAVSDERCRFMSVSTGFPGRLHDARVFRNSNLYDSLDQLIEDDDMHLIGDVAYPMKPKLMTPFKDNGHLTRNQIRYNKKLSSVRSTVERAFGRLKGKFRRLKLLELSRLDLISNTIVACCVLHNMIINVDDLSDEEYSSGEDDMDDDDLPLATAEVINCSATAKRNQIAAVV